MSLSVSSSSIFIDKHTFKRLINDVVEIRKNPLISHGVHYFHNEDDVLKGKALIIGQKDTPYENGFYLFDLDFPPNYPHAPPTVTFRTNDGQTRMNPNLYIQGKVCLSILNTWQGEQWSGCQTISTVLLALCTLFIKNPLLNEPGITETHKDLDNYNSILTFKNFDTAMLLVLTNEYFSENFPMFLDTMKTSFKENYDYNVNKIRELHNLYPKKIHIRTSLYSMDITVDYKKLLQKFIDFVV